MRSVPHLSHTSLSHTIFHTHHLSHTSLSHTTLSNTIFVSHTHTTLSHTIFHTHTQLCHTPSSHTTLSHTTSTHNSVTHHLSHTIFVTHTQLCHTPSFTHTHTTLSHTIFHKHLCHTLSFTHISPPSFRHLSVAGVALLTHGWVWWHAWVPLVARDAAALLRGRRGTWRPPRSFAWQAWHF